MSCKTYYHQECACLFTQDVMSDRCLKRFYRVRDVKNDNFKRIAICNEYVRLRVNNLIAADEYRCENYLAREAVEQILSEHVEIKKRNTLIFGYQNNDLLESDVSICVCDRPYITSYYNVREAAKMAINGNRIITQPLMDYISNYLERMQYKKYKTRYKLINSLMKKIEREYDDQTRSLMINEMFIELWKMDINNKKQAINKN